MTFRSAVKVALYHTGLLRPVARLANDLLNTTQGRNRRRLLALYRPLIQPGQLVFDIGGNDGTYAEAFAAIGARVLTVEPNPALIATIRMACPSSVTIVETAVGARPGTATLKMQSRPGYDGASTMSDEWIATAQAAPRWAAAVWDREISVPITTLDALWAQHGEPDYIKIDIEGYEEEALRGLSRQPRLLSLEYNTEALAALRRCLALPIIGARSRFNYVMGYSTTLAVPGWLDRAEFDAHVGRLAPESFGDVFIQRG